MTYLLPSFIWTISWLPAVHPRSTRSILDSFSNSCLLTVLSSTRQGVSSVPRNLIFLGHHVSAIGIAPLPDRVAALRDSKPPQNRTSLQRFLGMINYYHRFLPELAPILAPLHAQASGKGQSIEWSAECQASFDEVKEILARSVLLHHPLPDAPTSLTVDASSTAVGAQLEQRQGQSWVPLAFFSRKLSDAEKKYSAFDRELLASYSAL